MSTQTQPPARLRSSLANAAWVVEERVVWGGADVLRGVPSLLRGIADVVKWPFERAMWAIERAVIWPLEERTAPWDGPLRIAGTPWSRSPRSEPGLPARLGGSRQRRKQKRRRSRRPRCPFRRCRYIRRSPRQRLTSRCAGVLTAGGRQRFEGNRDRHSPCEIHLNSCSSRQLPGGNTGRTAGGTGRDQGRAPVCECFRPLRDRRGKERGWDRFSRHGHACACSLAAAPTTATSSQREGS